MSGSLSISATARRGVAASVLLAVLVVLVAGLAGRPRLSGPRWLPSGVKSHSKAVTAKAKLTTPKLPRETLAHAGSQFPLTQILAVMLALLALLAAWRLWRWWVARSATNTSSRVGTMQPTEVVMVGPEPEPDPPALLSGIELALQTLDEQRDPSDAIVRAWLGLQQTAEESGIVRQPSQTPTEFTARILQQAFTDDRAVRTLLRLYLRTRFGDHPPTADDVTAVRAALSELVQNWRSSGALTSAAGR